MPDTWPACWRRSTRLFGGHRRLLDYVSRYTHDIAFSNHRLVGLAGEEVVVT